MRFKTIKIDTSEANFWWKAVVWIWETLFAAGTVLGVIGGILFIAAVIHFVSDTDTNLEFRQNCRAANGIPVLGNVCVRKDAIIEVKP